MKIAFAITAGVLTLGTTQLAQADYCRFYTEEHSAGSTETYNLPSVNDHGGTSWYAASSIRRTRNSLPADVYENAESVRIVAEDSDVHLYTFTGDNFDGDVQVIRCNKGHTCTWTYGWMKNMTHSFICQREHDVGMALIPTSPVGDSLTGKIDQKIESSSRVEDNDTKYGRMRWSTGIKRCADTDMCGPDDVVLPYHDELQYSYKSELDPEWQVREYNVWIDFWLRPRVASEDRDSINVREAAWKFSVEGGPAQDEIMDALRSQIDRMYPELGETVTKQIFDGAIAAVGADLANRALRNLNRIVLTYTCEGSRMPEIFVKAALGASLSQVQKDDPCDRRVNSSLLSPHIALVKDVNQ